nr:peptidoglycan-binding protein LysM [Paracoccus nototheniae]
MSTGGNLGVSANYQHCFREAAGNHVAILDGDDVHLRLRGDTVIVESKGADREALEKLILAVGNIQGIAKVEADLPPEAPQPVFHTVAKGETLSAIAKAHLGDASKYNAIFEANRPMLSDPDKIYPGQMLRIPPQQG